MPIQIKAPDGSIAQFPDGTPDHVITAAMAREYPQPSWLDRAAASPLGRLAHDVVGGLVKGVTYGPDQMVKAALPMLGQPAVAPISAAIDQPYEGALARNRNTPGYADARQRADKITAARGGSGLSDQLIAPFTPALAGAAGFFGGSMDTSNAAADSQAAAQAGFQQRHPLLSFGAGMLGGLTMGAPEATLGKVPAVVPRVPALRPGAQEAMTAGYKLPPRMITEKPGLPADVLAAWSGKTKTAQAASAANQEVTNGLAATSLGLPRDTVLTEKVLSDVRKNAGKAYEAIPQALPHTMVDQEFLNGIADIKAATSGIETEFPGLAKNEAIDNLVSTLSGKTSFSTKPGLELVKQLRKDAGANFRAANDPAKLELAFAQRKAADQIDSLVERNIDNMGLGDLAKEYRSARQLIAKAHDVETATNLATGNVNARKIAALAARGKPFTGELSTIANTAQAFPKAMQSESAFGEVEPLSVLDMAGAGLTAAHGNVGAAGVFLGRPIARGAVLSAPMQKSIASRATMPALPVSPAVSRLTKAPLPVGLFGSGAYQLPPKR